MQVTNNEIMEIVSSTGNRVSQAISGCQSILKKEFRTKKDKDKMLINILSLLSEAEGRLLSLEDIVAGEIDRENMEREDN